MTVTMTGVPRRALSNELYLVVLPLVHVSSGLTEQTITLLPDKNFATHFFPDEVDTFISMFISRANRFLIGGHVTSYQCFKVQLANGLVAVRVIQNVG